VEAAAAALMSAAAITASGFTGRMAFLPISQRGR